MTDKQVLPVFISEHEPRKGTETSRSRTWSNTRRCYFRTRTPKGDGNASRGRSYSYQSTHFRTRTPKGDGNRRFHVKRSTGSATTFQNTNPERGRKLEQPSPNNNANIRFQNTNPERGRKPLRVRSVIKFLHCISEHEPRKGTETHLQFSILVGNEGKFQNTNPERGRKRRITKLPLSFLKRFQNTNPERGRKPQAFARSYSPYDHFRTRTPKGDGNDTLGILYGIAEVISEHEPRKGTET